MYINYTTVGMTMVCRKLRIADIVGGKWDEETRSLSTILGETTEVRAFGTVMDKFISEDENYSHLILDDGTETIRIKTWRDDVERLNGIEKGDIVDVIGRLSYYNEEIYISPKIVKKIPYNFWLLRHLEIVELLETLPEEEREIEKIDESKEPEEEIVTEDVAKTEEVDEVDILDTDETAKTILELLDSEELSRDEIVERTAFDEIDVELALRELIDEEKIEEKEGKFMAVSQQ